VSEFVLERRTESLSRLHWAERMGCSSGGIWLKGRFSEEWGGRGRERGGWRVGGRIGGGLNLAAKEMRGVHAN